MLESTPTGRIAWLSNLLLRVGIEDLFGFGTQGKQFSAFRSDAPRIALSGVMRVNESRAHRNAIDKKPQTRTPLVRKFSAGHFSFDGCVDVAHRCCATLLHYFAQCNPDLIITGQAG